VFSLAIRIEIKARRKEDRTYSEGSEKVVRDERKTEVRVFP